MNHILLRPLTARYKRRSPNAMKKIIFILSVVAVTIIGCNNVVRVNDNEKESTTTILESDLAEAQNHNDISSCEEGEALAKKDLEDGKIKYIFGSFGSRQDLPKNLERLYDIEIINVEGVLGIPNKCYNDIMYKAIQSKFGKDAFNKAME